MRSPLWVAGLSVDLPDYTVTEAYGAQLRTFRCTPHDATLTVTGCADRWKAAQDARGVAYHSTRAVMFEAEVKASVRATEHGKWQGNSRRRLALAANRVDAVQGYADGLDVCARCPLGARHAECLPINTSQHYGALICPRCSKGTTRMIGNSRCVSCYNREREVAKGRNGRGNRPERLAPIHAIGLRLVVDNVVQAVEVQATSTAEVVLQALRTTRGSVAFAPRRQSFAAQLQLAFA